MTKYIFLLSLWCGLAFGQSSYPNSVYPNSIYPVSSTDSLGESTLDYNYCGPMTSDTAASTCSYIGTNAYSQAATNKNGGGLVLSGGIQTQFYTVVANSLGAVTVTTTVDGVSVALASTTDFALGSDDTAPQLLVTSTALAAAINANATLKAKLTATASAAIVYLTPKTGVISSMYIATSAAPRISITVGTFGSVNAYGSALNVCNSFGKCGALTVHNGNAASAGLLFAGAPLFGEEAVAVMNSSINGTTAFYAGNIYARTYTGSGAISFMTQGTFGLKATTGSYRIFTTRIKTCTFAGGGGAATCVTSGLILDGEKVDAILGFVTTTGSNCTTMTAGDGSDVDRYSSAFVRTAGTTFTPALATAETAHTALAAEEVTLTGDANCIGTVVNITAHIVQFTAPTS